MPKFKRKAKGDVIVKKGRTDIGGVRVDFDKTLTVNVSARDCLEFASGALRDWYAEAHRTGQRYDAGMLPRDRNGWVAYESGLLSTRWRFAVDGNDTSAQARVWISPPDTQRALRLASLSRQGIRLSGLSGKAQDVYTRAVGMYMADAVSAE